MRGQSWPKCSEPLGSVSGFTFKRVERVHPELPAQIHGRIQRNWGEVAERCKRLALP